MSDDQELAAEILNEVISEIMSHEDLQQQPWTAFGLAAEVYDDQSVVQAAFCFDDDGTARSVRGVQQSFSLVELRDASRGTDGSTWDVFVLKIHGPTGQVSGQFLTADQKAAYPLGPQDNDLLVAALRPQQAEFDEPIS